eukprot:CAMPEP_0176261926 /NCGR_PEP_ID=MMETSP0121_2-20121125/40349_1 /TAXON_ID=160619 /ORGANISM="Kryptoperidinium foliaceum, Strain CCMP 1326" /LENGTH=50 /DNA_ID=CAMNT_0017601881 /DNA_START=105 /DNA_END=253 /DNA_ORIENTATION=+
MPHAGRLPRHARTHAPLVEQARARAGERNGGGGPGSRALQSPPGCRGAAA